MAIKFRSRTVIFIHDLGMAALAWLGAYWLRFNLSVPPELEWQVAIRWLPLVVLVQAAIFRRIGLYRGVWRFASVPDLVRIAKAVGVGVLTVALTVLFANRLYGVPRSVFPLYGLLLVVFLAAPRLIYRIWKDRGAILSTGRRALVVGAGQTGEALVRDLLRARDARFVPVCFVDDDPRKKGTEIHGVRVKGRSEQIPKLVERFDIDTVLLAMPSATDRQMQRVVGICETAAVPFLTCPSLEDIFSGQVAGSLREVSIEDLLGRAQIRLDRNSLHGHLAGKQVLVTGGGGSIGSELCKQIARFAVAELVIFERCEYNLYRIEKELRRQFPGLPITPLLGDVTDRVTVERMMRRFNPQVIFHAAAYKHVPLLQYQVQQAVLNNILGTRVVAEAALAAGAGEFVLISTDKAVRPGNVMGATKRAAEMLVQSLNGLGETRFITVRFGNVLDSAGSVVPLFREQIRAGGPVTVTDPEVTRYFMTIPEACQLIMQAAALGKGGEIFVLDMGEPVKIGYLAEQMIILSGKRPGTDIQIEYIGLRPGEKLTEELFQDDERPHPTTHPKLLLANSIPLDHRFLKECVKELADYCSDVDEESLLRKLKALVPDFDPVPALAGPSPASFDAVAPCRKLVS